MWVQVVDVEPAILPAWADELVSLGHARAWRKRVRGVDLRVRCGQHFALLEATVADAAELGEKEFGAAVEAVYGCIALELGGLDTRYPVRFWNYLPQIRHKGPGGLDRYMVFNAARQAAFRRWYRGASLGGNLPTASALDAGRPELIVHALAAAHPGRSFENPRQVPAYRYSSRYGPQPPCFSRATAVPAGDDGSCRLLIGGTASIVGEATRHPADLRAQLDETADNLTSVLHALQPGGPSTVGGERDQPGSHRLLCELRAYVVRTDDRDAVVAHLCRRFPDAQRLEVMRARLCRRALLVEVEALALCDIEPPDSYVSFENAVGLAHDPAGRN